MTAHTPRAPGGSMLLSRGALFGVAAIALAACGPDKPVGPDVNPSVMMDISAPLRDMAKLAPAFQADGDEIRGREAEPARPIPHPAAFSAAQTDPVIQHEPGTAPIATTLVNFEAQGAGL